MTKFFEDEYHLLFQYQHVHAENELNGKLIQKYIKTDVLSIYVNGFPATRTTTIKTTFIFKTTRHIPKKKLHLRLTQLNVLIYPLL